MQHISKYNNKNIPAWKVLTVLLILLAAILSLFLLPALMPFLFSDSLHGYSSNTTIDIPISENEPHTTPMLIVAAFSDCEDICPANFHIIKQINRESEQALNLGVINLKGHQTEDEYVNWISNYTGFTPVLLNNTPLLHEQTQFGADGEINHSGNLYLYFPKAHELLTYPNPNAEKILQDLQRKSRITL